MDSFFKFLALLGSVLLFAQNPDFQNQDFTRAPNSYIYDINLAKTQNFGGIKIPVTKAYEMWAKSPLLTTAGVSTPIPEDGVMSASVFWEDVPGLIKTVSILPANDFASNAYIKVMVDHSKGKGNAVIAFKVNNVIYWSWHIWVTDDPTNSIAYNNGMRYADLLTNRLYPTYMDRNLGATSNTFLGYEWTKSGGLMYQFGRKDPLPPLEYKDESFYELSGEAGNIRHAELPLVNGYSSKMTNQIKVASINENIKTSIQKPLTPIVNATATDATPWYSSSSYVSGTTTHNLWADNTNGVNTASTTLQLKSPFDPCPNGWRVPTFISQQSAQNSYSPWGFPDINAYNSNTNYNDIGVITENPYFKNILIYPGLGIDFRTTTSVPGTNRGMGKYALSGRYNYYSSTAFYHQDIVSESLNWSGTLGASGQVRSFHIINDIARANNPVQGVNTGLFQVQSHALFPSGQSAAAVRCIKDPNFTYNYPTVDVSPSYDFPTQYLPAEDINFTDGLQEPNSYIVLTDQIPSLKFQITKAFSVHNQYLSDHEMLPADQLKLNLTWTTNPNLIKKITLFPAADPKFSFVLIEFNPGEKGNAVVSLHNGSVTSPAYWSWHIWCPNGNPTMNTPTHTTELILKTVNVVNATRSGAPPLTTTFMDRNLGAIDALPSELATMSNADLIAKAKNSGGLQYQWGRKDPIPSFVLPGNSGTYSIFKGITDATGITTYTEINSAVYQNQFTVSGIASAINAENLKKHEKIAKTLKFSVQNPLTLMYEPTGKDWISNVSGLADYRWGHADKKSVFDPCPEGWRVPDVSFVKTEESLKSTPTTLDKAKGFSPWYYGGFLSGNKKVGLDQITSYTVETQYKGKIIRENPGTSALGWIFNNISVPAEQQYLIGNYPSTGIRNLKGTNNTPNATNTTRLWTAALAERMLGYGISMAINDKTMMSGTGKIEDMHPQSALNVRCVKDTPRYSGEVTQSVKREALADPKAVEEKSTAKIAPAKSVFPNPFQDVIHFTEKGRLLYEIFDISGKLVKKGMLENSLNLNELPKGNYIISYTNEKGEKRSAKILKN